MAVSVPSDLWPQVERLLSRVERPSRYIDHEWGAHRREMAAYRVALMYPDAYEVGMANQALQVLADRLREIDDIAIERVFLPWVDMAAAMRETGVPLFTLESCAPVADVDLLGITLSNELTYSNVLEALDLAGIPLRAADRDDTHPLVIGGGPSAHNPEPMASFFDAILIGDGEDAVLEIVAADRAAIGRGAKRMERVRALAAIEGVYVPSLYAPGPDGRLVATAPAPGRVRRRVLADLDSYPAPTCPVVPYADVVHDRATVEVLRGCSRGCRFCQAGMVYRPVRERSADSIVRDALAGLTCTGYEELSLTSLSTADHSQLEAVLRRLVARLDGTGTAISVPSLRVDSFTVPLARLLGDGRKSGLTFAPEAGSQRLRDAINKNITEEEIITAVEQAFTAGWRRVKLYFMIGLPTEIDDDVRAIGALVERVLGVAREATPKAERGGLRVAVSVSTFVPKAHTPFQWDGQVPIEEVRRRQGLLRESMPHRGVELSWHDPSSSLLEAVLARGGREMADGIEAAWRAGARFDAWTEHFSLGRWLEAFASVGIDAAEAASAPYIQGGPLPWSHIDSGLAEGFLRLERSRTDSATTTPDCTFEDCTGCGVCPGLGVENVIAGGGSRA
ncbi:MAG: TIGR03960 family B12-binding radical SAM protein [Coriobacteriia bacterium]|nr:TIGR03960 family B12-binding radical SAM protein [Coriobacteriia bacterium]MBN2840303.1 TIGR03960 family B12-binding radical SAM protein [Coriobacteriia bacterium]